MNILEEFNKKQLKADIPDFAQGDDVVVQVKVKEGDRVRLQAYEGVVIAIKNRGLHSSFTVRKISHGEGVERVFQTHSPLIESIKVKRKGKVRRSKLYYLRQRSGKSARIAEKKDIIKKVNQNPSNTKASKKEAKINSLENKDSIQKTKETINQEVDKENKKESK